MAFFSIAFDIGSKVAKCAIGNERADILAMESFRPAVVCSEDGFCRACDEGTYWNDILALCKRTIKSARIDAGQVKYITCSSIRPSCVFTDKDNNPLYIGSSFDMRGINSADVIEPKFEKVASKTFFRATGHFPILMYPPARYAWYKDNESKACGEIAKYFPVDSWILARFGAEDHANADSAAESGFYDIEHRDWNYEWSEVLDLPGDFFPPVVRSGEIVGDVARNVQLELGLPSDAVVVSGLPDTQAALVGAGCLDDRDACVVVGSTTPVQLLKHDLFFDEKMQIWTTTFGLKNIVDSYVLEASTGITGQILNWAAGLFYADDGQFKKEYFKKFDAEYDALDAEEVSSPAQVRDIFAFLGPDHLASSQNTIVPGVFVFPTPGTVEEVALAKRQFIASVFDNIQFAVFKNLQFLEHTAGKPVKDRYLLGGVTRNATFCQRFADLTGSDVRTAVEKEATITGLLITCMVASGGIKSAGDIKRLIDDKHGVDIKHPRSAMGELLHKRFQKWDSMRGKIKEL
nr:FGGY-family carbohydrate kinase [Candidatus Sigynarchaeota archaeon]